MLRWWHLLASELTNSGWAHRCWCVYVQAVRAGDREGRRKGSTIRAGHGQIVYYDKTGKNKGKKQGRRQTAKGTGRAAAETAVTADA